MNLATFNGGFFMHVFNDLSLKCIIVQGEIDQLTFNASGRWVVGENSVREEFQDEIRRFANIDRGRNLQTMHLCK